MERRLLKAQIKSAWRAAMSSDYCSQRINSERSLQASVWRSLFQIFDEESRKAPRGRSTAPRHIFIEAPLSLLVKGKRTVRRPDIIVCDANKIIAVIELKYTPRVGGAHQKDVETLRLIADARTTIAYTNARQLGHGNKPVTFTLADDSVFVWAGVHNDANKVSEPLSGPTDIGSGPEATLLELHTLTKSGESPKIIVRDGPKPLRRIRL